MKGKSRSDIEKEIEKEIKKLVKNGEGLEADEISFAIYDMLGMDDEEIIRIAENFCFNACYLKEEGRFGEALSNFTRAGKIYEKLGKHDWANSCYEENFYVVEKSDHIYLVRFIPEENDK